MAGGDALARALACIAPERLAKADAARLRFQRRQARLARLSAQRGQASQSLLHEALARAKAKADALRDDNTSG